MTRKEKIIKLYETQRLMHPSYSEIAHKTGVTKQYVAKVVQNYLKSLKQALQGK